MALRSTLALVFLCGCGARSAVSDGGLRLCPPSGGENCFLLTPAETGLSGQGAKVDQYALRPASGARGLLLVFLNGSGGTPQSGAAGLERSWYGALARTTCCDDARPDEGRHVHRELRE